MPFGLCNVSGMFQRCIMAIVSYMVERTIKVFIDDFSVLRKSFDNYLENLRHALIRCEETNLVLNWENFSCRIYLFKERPLSLMISV